MAYGLSDRPPPPLRDDGAPGRPLCSAVGLLVSRVVGGHVPFEHHPTYCQQLLLQADST